MNMNETLPANMTTFRETIKKSIETWEEIAKEKEGKTITVKCVICGIEEIKETDRFDHYKNQGKIREQSYKNNTKKEYFCIPCWEKFYKKRKAFIEKFNFRMNYRKNLKERKFEKGIKKRFLDCSFENYKGKNYKTEFVKSNKEENILISGNAGSGKTHLACAYMSVKLWHGENCIFITTAEVLMDIRASFKDDSKITEEELIENFINIDILFLDDIGIEKTTEWVLQTLYLIIDGRYSEKKQTVFTSNLSPKEISEKLGDRMASRICSGKIIKIKSNDYRLNKEGKNVTQTV
jgi:DNA replication protein DnaC